MWLIYAFLSALFAGLTAILAKIGIKKTDSNLTTALRTVVVVLFAWLMTLIDGSWQTLGQISGRSYLFLVLSGMATGASWLCYFRALQLGDVNKVVPIDKSSTVLTMMLGILLFGETFSWLTAVCMIFIAAGTLLMIEKKDGGNENRTGNKWIIFAVLSAVFASLTSILAKVGIENVEPNAATAVRTMVVLVMAWGIVFAGKLHQEIKTITRRSWTFITLSGIATGASWLCYYRALQEGPVSIVVPIDKLSILVTVLFAYFMFGEKLTGKSALGLLMITAGTFILCMM